MFPTAVNTHCHWVSIFSDFNVKTQLSIIPINHTWKPPYILGTRYQVYFEFDPSNPTPTSLEKSLEKERSLAMLRSRDRNAHQANHKNNYIRSTIEKNSKQDKVHRKKIENRNRFIYGGLPRIGCCLLMVLFCIGLSYRMTDRVIRHIPKKKSHHRSAKETTAATTQRSNNLQKKKSRRTSLLKNIHNKSIVYKSGQSVHILTKQEKKRQQEHLTHLKQHGNLLAAAKIHQTHQHGPHAPKGHRKYELTESERQGK